MEIEFADHDSYIAICNMFQRGSLEQATHTKVSRGKPRLWRFPLVNSGNLHKRSLRTSLASQKPLRLFQI